MKRNKFYNKKVVYDGILFDSKRERDRYTELKMLEKIGAISGLELQKSFTLIPSQYINGKVVERAVKYKADFCYTERDSSEYVVEDTKGVKTKDYIIKRKLMLSVYGIRIREI